ncbi:gluconate 2-dehydrogenase subunit 3 family protein [Thalassobaculum sp. OXR-137]|uniref:gluconate 2-dehydrogenase subunit 3 family protein n=1 Tax=Thalassobaculum sp. OXR-137 TaxID=3100173 RepID=UPI002AC97F8A|nr:gluconate 2-dehydrogenase subunit 3 family protein [Thalassobaculum sp. OXR-137]WPZ32216.1 gluconate 2-dehydrogenase subunit 3 family protein [Thalassobaculum sp. OXR-137]
MHMLRRSFLVGVSALALAAGAQAREFRGGIPWTSGKAQPPNDFDASRRFLTDEERTFVTAAVDRLIPADDTPSASELGVVDYIDAQLAGAYGRGDIYYLQPPFQAGLATQGYQAEAPALLYRQAIADIEAFLAAANNGPFADLDDDAQDDVLTRLSEGEIELEHVHAKTFFDTLWQNTLEGFFGDPVYGGNRDMQGWRMIGFPGARYDYRPWIDHGGKPVILDPVSVARRTTP